MQTMIQVFSKDSKSLRTKIVDDPQLRQFDLIVSGRRKKGRPKGWAKLSMQGSDGVINIEWHAASQMLICRVVTKGGKPYDITGAFIRFLLARFSKQIASVHILPPH
jgi:hypothetical protein